MGKRYRVKDSETGRTITFTWNGETPPTEKDLGDIFGAGAQPQQAPPPIDTMYQQAAPSSTVPSINIPPPPKQDEGPGFFRQLANIRSAYSTPIEKAQGIGTALEVGLPFLANGLSAGLAIPASGALAGTGTLVKNALMQAAGAPRTPLTEQFKEAGTSATFGAAGQAAGAGVGALIKKAAAPMAKYVNPATLAFAEKAGVQHLPSEVLSETSMLPALQEAMERVAGSTVGGGSILNPVRMGRKDQLLSTVRGTFNRAIAALEEPRVVQEAAVSGLEKTRDAFRALMGKEYRKLDNLVGQRLQPQVTTSTVPSSILQESGVPFSREVSKETPRAVDLTLIKRAAKGILERLPEEVRIAAGSGGTEAGGLYSQLAKTAQLPDFVPFEHAQFYRSQLLQTIREGGSVVDGKSIGSSKKLAQLFDSRMRSAAQKAGILSEYEAVNNSYREGIRKFENRLVEKLADSDPEKLAKEIIRPQNSSNIKEVRAAIGESAFEKIKRQGAENWIRKGNETDDLGHEFFNGRKALAEWNKLGDETRNAAFSKAEQDEITNTLKALSQFSTKRQTPGLWGMAQGAGLMTGGALAGGAIGNIPGALAGGALGATTGIMFPAWFSKLITSPRGRQWLTTGLKIPPGTEQAVNFLNRFGAWAAKEGIDISPTGQEKMPWEQDAPTEKMPWE